MVRSIIFIVIASIMLVKCIVVPLIIIITNITEVMTIKMMLLAIITLSCNYCHKY